MRNTKLMILLVALLAATGCTCKSKKVGAGADNIPSAMAGDVLKDINFDFDKSALTPLAKTILDENSNYLAANTSVKVQIEGHCDERGTNEYNMKLGANRARTALEYLRAKGIDASRLSTVSYGEELPLDPAKNEAAYAKNRRDHFNVTAK
jgi:peptidoglycan-associated lipoprotein